MQEMVISQALDFWINPEIERRRGAGTLPDDFALSAAQAYFADSPTHSAMDPLVEPSDFNVWLGRNSSEGCTLPSRLLIRTASNAYF